MISLLSSDEHVFPLDGALDDADCHASLLLLLREADDDDDNDDDKANDNDIDECDSQSTSSSSSWLSPIPLEAPCSSPALQQLAALSNHHNDDDNDNAPAIAQHTTPDLYEVESLTPLPAPAFGEDEFDDAHYYQGLSDQARIVSTLTVLLRHRFPHNEAMTQHDDGIIDLGVYLGQLVSFVNDAFGDFPGTGSTGVRCLVLAAIYYERKSQPHRGGYFASLHREMLICSVVAVKYNEEDSMLNTCWEVPGRLPSQTINALEADLCAQLDFRLFVSPEEFDYCLDVFASAEV